jgi:NAD-dependent dihydropyrimidine dehydrogenase PreA subunit
MDIKSSAEIIEDFLHKYNFQLIYKDKLFQIPINGGVTEFNLSEALNYLIGASFTGNKSIGFFRKVKYINFNHLLRGECLIVVSELPEVLSVPTIFCKDIDTLPESLPLALKVTFETKLPVMLVLSEDVISNYTANQISDCELDRVAPYLTYEMLENRYSLDKLIEQYQLAEIILSKSFTTEIVIKDKLAFNDVNAAYFNYLVPFVKNKAIDLLTQKNNLLILEEETRLIDYVLKHYKIKFKFSTYNKQESIPLKTILCPGCPFVSIFNVFNTDEKLFITDIACESIKKAFKIQYAEVSQVMGYIYNMKNTEICFIGNLSNFHAKYIKHFENITCVLLNDCHLEANHYPPVSKPSKLKEMSCIFPYSCNNIKSYGKVTLKEKKCLCIPNGKQPICMEKTFCPAISIKGDIVQIDQNVCILCENCKTTCPYGALK